MPSTKDLVLDTCLQIMIFAPSKAGKSFGAYSFPRPNVLDFDNGIATALNPAFIKKYGRRDIMYQQFREKNIQGGIVQVPQAFDDACRYFDLCMQPANRDKFDTWVIDSGTTLVELAMNKAIMVLGGANLSKTFESAKKTGVIMLKMQDYGSERSLTEQFVDMVKGSGKHVVFICHEKEKYADDGQTITAKVPLLTGKSVEAISLKFDEIYYLKVTGNAPDQKRVLQTQQTGLVKCGSRYGIPDGTAWDYDSIMKELTAIRTAVGKTADTPSDTKVAGPK